MQQLILRENIAKIDHLHYLGSIVHKGGNIEDDVEIE